METRDGLIEFRQAKIPVQVQGRTFYQKVTEYRQCFKGIWTPWQKVPFSNQ